MVFDKWKGTKKTVISFWQLVIFPLSTEKNKGKSLFLDTSSSCQCPSTAFWAAATHQKFGEGESAAEGSLAPCSTLTAPGPPKGFRGNRQQPRAPVINGKISTDFRQVSVLSRHFCSRHSHYWFHLFQQTIKHISTNPHPTSTSCCPAWHYRWTGQSDPP